MNQRTPEKQAYLDARRRCINPRCQRYESYGGRGIEFKYSSFEAFMADMGPRPSKLHSLDRIDVNGHYEPGNCRWATMREQTNNRRTNRLLTFAGQTKNISAWAGFCRKTAEAIRNKLRNGATAETALTSILGNAQMTM
jgi:hypothetical protein